MSEFTCPEGNETSCALYGKAGRCNLCDGSMFFEPIKKKAPVRLRTQKKSKRMGAKFEEENHEQNMAIVGRDSCFLTPNSGAGNLYKGDEWKNGFCSVMQELKTNVKPKVSRGSKSYTVKRQELEKVKREGDEANIEFYYLKFRFLESDAETYSIISDEIMNSIIATLNEDRKKVALTDSTVNYFKAKYLRIEAEKSLLEAKVRELEAELALVKIKEGKEG